jgi:maltose alpha-D-glucosyltransferase/alpha-amylase
MMGAASYAHDTESAASMLMLQHFVRNQGNGWEVTIEELRRYFDRVTALPPITTSRDEAREWALGRRDAPPEEVEVAILTYLATAEVLGRRTGEMHVHLASAPPDDPTFAAELFTADDARATAEHMQRHADDQLRLLETSLDRLDERRRELANQVLAHRSELLHHLDELRQVRSGAARIRCHGDYHLGQVLVDEGDVVILDFEGEPARPLEERRRKCSPLRDVAGMLRSFGYAALTGLNAATIVRPDDVERLAPWAEVWETWVSAAFLRAYLSVTRDRSLLPVADDFDVMLQAFVTDKALYELGYELNNRPDWVHIPLAGLLRMRSTQHA